MGIRYYFFKVPEVKLCPLVRKKHAKGVILGPGDTDKKRVLLAKLPVCGQPLFKGYTTSFSF
jgi:hypothetical protein